MLNFFSPLQHETGIPVLALFLADMSNGRAFVWDAAIGQILTELNHGAAINVVRMTTDGQLSITAGEDGAVRVGDIIETRESQAGILCNRNRKDPGPRLGDYPRRVSA